MRTVYFASLALLASGLTVPAIADDGLLETLKAKNVLTADEYDRLKAQQTPAPAPAPTQNVVSTDSGLRVQSSDGQYALEIGTLQQLDFAAHDDHKTDLSDGSTLRRSRLSIGGFFLKDFQYRVEYEFSGTTSLTDAYVAYSALKPLTITVGQFKQPFGMEALSADKGTTFMERGLPFSFITTRAPGAMIGSSGAHWSAHAGAFGEPVGNAASGDEGYGVVGRVTYAPYAADHRVLHLGVGITYRDPTQNNSSNTTGAKFSTVRFSGKPESGVLAQRSIDTGEIADVSHYTLEGLEGAGQIGAASIQAEYQLAQVERRGGSQLNFGGWYTQLAYTLTGEARPYSASRGVFNTIVPAHNLGRDGWGAFEIAARVSGIDLNDGNVIGGRERNAALALNWYLNPILRISGNVVKVLQLDGGPLAGDKPTIFQTRLQLVF